MSDYICIEGTYVNKSMICYIDFRDHINRKKSIKFYLILGFPGTIKEFTFNSREDRNKIVNTIMTKDIPIVNVASPVYPIRPLDNSSLVHSAPNINAFTFSGLNY